MSPDLTAAISAAAIRHNVRLLRERTGPAVKLCAVVKADCYGHGLPPLMGLLEELADSLAVATADEAIQLRRLGYEGPILMLLPPCGCGDRQQLRDMLVELIAANVTLTVCRRAEIEAIARGAGHVGGMGEVHVKIDTGMHRGGVEAGAAVELIALARERAGVRLAGLYTHFAAADEADKTFTRRQLQCFVEVVEAAGGRSGLTLHAANSAAAIDLPETHLDMIRPGIAVYGCQPSAELASHLPLRPALRLTAPLMLTKTVPAGGRCGYGLTHTFPQAARIGLVPVGYGDGYPRCLSNRSTMRIAGRDVPVRGRVSMDQVIVELTDVPEAGVGDEVEVICDDPAAPHSAENLARLAGTIPYEITCALGRRARRVLVD